jgi:hypothetical protein
MTPLLVSTRTTRFLAAAAGFCPSELGAGFSAGAGVLPLPEQPVISSIDADSINNIVWIFFPMVKIPPSLIFICFWLTVPLYCTVNVVLRQLLPGQGLGKNLSDNGIKDYTEQDCEIVPSSEKSGQTIIAIGHPDFFIEKNERIYLISSSCRIRFCRQTGPDNR